MRFNRDVGKPLFNRLIISIKNRWVLLLVSLGISAHILSILFTIAFTSITWPTVGKDPAVFQYGGWYIIQGGVPYVGFWDVKPPLIYFLTSGLALISSGDMSTLHNLGWAFSSLSTTGTSLVIGLIVYFYTNDELSSLAGGASLFFITQFYGLPRWGVYPQFFSTLFASLTIYFLLKEKYTYVGLAATTATGFYYPEGIVLILSALFVILRGSGEDIKNFTKGTILISLLITIPLLSWGNSVPIIVETIIAPILTDTASSITDRTVQIILSLGPAILAIPLVGLGWFQIHKTIPRKGWIISAGGLLYTFRILLLGPGSPLHIMGWMVFAAIGIGYSLHKLKDSYKFISLVLVLLLVIISMAWTMPMFNLQPEFDDDGPVVSDPDVDRPGIVELYWEKSTIDYCHIRLSSREIQWIKMTDATLSDRRCGDWPSFIK